MLPKTACTRGDQVAKRRRTVGVAMGAALWVAGCASPGTPKAPSLRLPQVVKDLSATRVGPSVHLRWTTPTSTTDNLPVSAPISAVLCRQGAQAGSAEHGRCSVVAKLEVRPGPSEAEETLPAALTTGAPGLIAYRIELFNAAGRSAGRSAEAFAVSGAAPPAVAGLVATPVRDGVRLTWSALAEADGSRAMVELDRVEPAVAAAAPGRKRSSPELPGAGKPRPEVHLGANEEGKPDVGGTIDRSAEKGSTYRYVAERVQVVDVGGHRLNVRSVPSQAVTVTVLDTFPPQPPVGLESVAGGGAALSIDLSWRPGAEADLAGYNVYRRELGPAGAAAWVRRNATLVAVPGYTDATVQAGVRYAYRITAVDSRGNESAPGPEVEETAGNR